ncbi:MAG: hypothetical protein J0L94_16240 [Rhodothermia bacterium]|nr:hypothetical protein [Rhodothermia bacterium]
MKPVSIFVFFLFLFVGGCDLLIEETYYKLASPETMDIVKEKVVLRGIGEGNPGDGVVGLLFERLRYTEKDLLLDINRAVLADNSLIPNLIPEKDYKIGVTYEITAKYDETVWLQDCKAIVPDHLFCTTRNRHWEYFPMATFLLTEIKEVP